MCRLLSETVRGMTHEDIISLARAAHGHPLKLTDLRQVCLCTQIIFIKCVTVIAQPAAAAAVRPPETSHEKSMSVSINYVLVNYAAC